MPLDASILICTRNRASALAECLDHLSRMQIGPATRWEVVVADNASTDATPAVIERFQARLPIRRVLEPRPGLSHARNAAIGHSTGRFILFTDDDCLVAPDWLETGIGLLRAEPHRIIGGRIALYDREALPLAVKDMPDREVLTDISRLIGFIHGANLIFARETLERIGLFDTRLGAGTKTKAAEDADFTYRAFIAGIPVQYEPALFVRHDHRRKGLDVWYRQMGDYYQGVGAMVAKYLLTGDTTPLKMAYWDFRSAVGMVRRNRHDWRRLVANLKKINGAILYPFA